MILCADVNKELVVSRGMEIVPGVQAPLRPLPYHGLPFPPLQFQLCPNFGTFKRVQPTNEGDLMMFSEYFVSFNEDVRVMRQR
jgi:hypothetical protein